MKIKFPIKKYKKINHYFEDYFDEFLEAKDSINLKDLNNIYKVLYKTYSSNKKIFVCGNGGSAAIANHFECDHKKILFENTKIKPRIISLCSNNSLISAIANDINYNSIFKKQLSYLAKRGDLLIAISSSGKSPNILDAIDYAKKNKMISISFTGFSGGPSKDKSDYNIHINSYNYGIVESLHHSIMNILAQYIRQKNSTAKIIKRSFF
jgi:phosphoheptose isomerase